MLQWALFRLGLLLGRRPLRVFLASLFLTVPFLSYFLFFPIEIETDVRRGFAHRSGRASRELKAFGEFYNVSVEGVDILLIFIESKQNGQLMRINSALLKEVERLDRRLRELEVDVPGEAKRIRMAQLHTDRGDLNFILKAYSMALEHQETRLLSNLSLESQIKLGYPVSRILGYEVPLVKHFFGVQPANDDGSDHQSDIGAASELQFARTIGIWYMLEGSGRRMRKVLARLELRVFELSKQDNFSQLFSFHVYADEIANYEMMRGSALTVRLLSIGIGSMVLFMLLTFWDYLWPSKILLIVLSMLSPCLAIVTAFALIGWIGIQFNSIMSIMPFLVLGIGVDNAFLLLHSWRKWSLAERDEGRRMASVVCEMGPSIAITSLTNGLAFGVGIFSQSAMMSSFCLCTTIAIVLDFFLEFGVFAPCLPLIRWKSANVDAQLVVSVPKSKMQKFSTSFCHHYARFIVSPVAKLCCFCLLSALFVFAFFGVRQMQANFEPQKTFPGDSALQRTLDSVDRVMGEHSPISFMVFRPPNIANRTELNRFMELISVLEALPNTYGPNSTELWLTGYLQFDRKRHFDGANSIEEYTPSYALLPSYLRDRRMADKRVVNYREHPNGSISVDSFVFVLSRRGALNWHGRAHFIDTLRLIVDKFGEFNVTVFDYDATIYDLILTVKTEVLKAALVTLVCMALVCFFVIPNMRNTCIATFSVLSISFSLVGALGWWGLDWDPVTMINVLMAIGFSVDFSAHICYHFNKNKSTDGESVPKTDQELVENILEAVGRPMLESAFSTVICVSPLFFLAIYVIAAFARTVLCVGVLGTIHGLFIVPVLLSLQIGGKRKEPKNGTENGIKNHQQQRQEQPLVDERRILGEEK